ncbi:MAG: hypothetical protein IPO43_06680 [Rhodoferax sp.]|nr:hypothetical protein [Rhodoferax sp.]
MVGLAGELRLSDNAVFLSFHANSGRYGMEFMSTVGAGFVAGLLEAVSRAGISRLAPLGRAGLTQGCWTTLALAWLWPTSLRCLTPQ